MIQEQDILLKKAEKKQISLQDNVKMLEQQLEETTQAMEAKDETISKLKQQIKSNETAEKIISNLRTDLAEQTEIAHNMHIKNQCLTIEKEKLSVLLSYKDTLITDYQDIKNEFIKLVYIYIYTHYTHAHTISNNLYITGDYKILQNN